MTTSLPVMMNGKKEVGVDGRRTCGAKGLVDHDVLEASQGFIGRLWEKDAFSCGETACFEDEGIRTRLDVVGSSMELICGKSCVVCRGDVVAGHEVFGKGL